MRVARDFSLTHYPNGTTQFSNVKGFENITNEFLVLLYTESNEDPTQGIPLTPICLLNTLTTVPHSYQGFYNFEDGSSVDIAFMFNPSNPTYNGAVSFTYRPEVLGISSLLVDTNAKAYMDKIVGLSFASSGASSGGTSSSDLEGVHSHLSAVQDSLNQSILSMGNNFNGLIGLINGRFDGVMNTLSSMPSSSNNSSGFNFVDLNGQFGSYRNGTKVTIEGKVDEYEVLSSSLVWSSYAGALVIAYQLKNDHGEICPCTHPFLTLVTAKAS